MNRDRRLSDVLHVLLHLGQANAPLTSDVLAGALGTNGAVFRRMMAGLRAADYVRSEKGRGGGWSLARPLDAITLFDVYSALGRPNLFAIGSRTDQPNCLVERNVNGVLSETMAEAEALFARRFGEITLDTLLPKATELAPLKPS